MRKIIELTTELATPAIAKQSCTLWDAEYVREAGTWDLRVLLRHWNRIALLRGTLCRARTDIACCWFLRYTLNEELPHALPLCSSKPNPIEKFRVWLNVINLRNFSSKTYLQKFRKFTNS